MANSESACVRVGARTSQWIGVGFCLVWTCAVLLFPVAKHDVLGVVPVIAGLLAGLAFSSRRIRTALGHRLMGMSSRTFLVVAIAIALGLRLLAFWLLYCPPGSDSGVYHAKAMDLVAGAGYGHTAFWPPGVPLLLAAWYWLTVPHYWAGYALGVLLSVGSVPVAYDVARRALGPLEARWAALLLAFMPTLVFTCARTDAGASLAFIVLAMADLVLLSVRRGWAGLLSAGALGALMGFACLVKPVFLLIPLVLLPAWLALGPMARAVRNALLCVALMACVVGPWTLRNDRVLGTPVLVSTNGGVNLFMGTNKASNGMYSRDVDPHLDGNLRSTRGPDAATAASGPPGEVDEIRLDREMRQVAIRRMAEHPGEFSQLAALKQVYMWGTSSTGIAEQVNAGIPGSLAGPLRSAIKAIVNAFWAFLVVVCFRGTLRTAVWKNPRLWAPLFFLIYLFVLHLFFEVQSRYHIPAIGALIMVAAAAMGDTGKESRQTR